MGTTLNGQGGQVRLLRQHRPLNCQESPSLQRGEYVNTNSLLPKKQKMSAITLPDFLTKEEFETIVTTKFPEKKWSIYDADKVGEWSAYTGPDEWRLFNIEDQWGPDCWEVFYTEDGWYINSYLTETGRARSIDEAVVILEDLAKSVHDFLGKSKKNSKYNII